LSVRGTTECRSACLSRTAVSLMPRVRAVVNALPVNATAFIVTYFFPLGLPACTIAG